jgi:hypothetical protein
LIQNQILLNRICQLVAQTHAVPIDWVIEESKKIGIEKVIESLEHQQKLNY